MYRFITKSSSAAGRTRRRLGNTSTCPCGVFRHITKLTTLLYVQVYQGKNTLPKNNEIQLIIMDIIQLNYNLSNIKNEAELMFLFNIVLSHLINKLSLISNKYLLVLWTKMSKSSNEGLWLQIRRLLRNEFSADGFPFFKINREIPMCSLDLNFKYLSVSP